MTPLSFKAKSALQRRTMRSEIENLAQAAKQSMGLLRRHL
jgi:hypothetical protein